MSEGNHTTNAMEFFCLNEMQEKATMEETEENAKCGENEKSSEQGKPLLVFTRLVAKKYAINMATSKRYFYLCTRSRQGKAKLLRVRGKTLPLPCNHVECAELFLLI